MLAARANSCTFGIQRPARTPPRLLELHRHRHRDHDRVGHLPHPGHDRHARAGSDAHACGLACGRADFAVRRAVSRRAGGLAATDRRLVRLPSGELGATRRVPVRLGRASADQGVCCRRHLDGIQRVPAPFDRLRPSGTRHIGRRHRCGGDRSGRPRQYPRRAAGGDHHGGVNRSQVRCARLSRACFVSARREHGRSVDC